MRVPDCPARETQNGNPRIRRSCLPPESALRRVSDQLRVAGDSTRACRGGLGIHRAQGVQPRLPPVLLRRVPDACRGPGGLQRRNSSEHGGPQLLVRSGRSSSMGPRADRSPLDAPAESSRDQQCPNSFRSCLLAEHRLPGHARHHGPWRILVSAEAAPLCRLTPRPIPSPQIRSDP